MASARVCAAWYVNGGDPPARSANYTQQFSKPSINGARDGETQHAVDDNIRALANVRYVCNLARLRGISYRYSGYTGGVE